MPQKKNILILMILTITLAAMVISGCTSTTSPSASPGASTSATTPAASGTPAGNQPSGAPAVSTSGSVTTVSGSQGGDFQFTSADTPYLFNIQAQDKNFELDYASNEYNHPENLYAGASGGYQQSFISSIPSKGQYAFTVKSSMPYTITMTPLPTGATPVAAPQTFSGKGGQVVGPITLNAGPANFNLNEPSMKDTGFSAQLYSDTTGKFVNMIDTNAASDATKDSYQSQQTVTIPAAGNYYILVFTNGNDAWSIGVSQ